MSNHEQIIDEVRQQIEMDLANAKRKTNLFFVIITICVAAFLTLWLTMFFSFTAVNNFPLIVKIIIKVGITIVFLGGLFKTRKNIASLTGQLGYEFDLQVMTNYPLNGDDYLERGYILQKRQQLEASLVEYEKALEIEPQNEDALDAIIDVLWYEQENGEAALPYVERLLAIDGDCADDAKIYYKEITGKEYGE